MAVQETRVLPAEFIEGLGKTYAADLTKAIGDIRGVDLSKFMGPGFVAPESALTQQAYQKAAGLGAYQPFVQAAEAATGPTAYQAYMSPYQQDVISETLREFDVKAQKGIPALRAQAIQAGAFGGGREGVAQAVYQSESDRNRAALQAKLLQQGFGQAQQLAQQQFAQQLNLVTSCAFISFIRNSRINCTRNSTTSSSSIFIRSTKTITTSASLSTFTNSSTIWCRYCSINTWCLWSNNDSKCTSSSITFSITNSFRNSFNTSWNL